MTPAKTAKSAGLKSLLQMSILSSVPIGTLRDWFYDKPILFKIVILGCKQQLKQPEEENATVSN